MKFCTVTGLSWAYSSTSRSPKVVRNCTRIPAEALKPSAINIQMQNSCFTAMVMERNLPQGSRIVNEARLGLEYRQQTAQLGLGFVFCELFTAEQSFIGLARQFLSPLRSWPIQFQRENSSCAGLVERVSQPLR